jgi:hypothetical protein
VAFGTRRAGVSTICWLARLRRGRRSNQPSQPCSSHSIRPIANHSRVRLISAESANNPATMEHQHARPALRHLCATNTSCRNDRTHWRALAHLCIPAPWSIWCTPRCQSTPSGVPRFRAPILRDDDRHETGFALPIGLASKCRARLPGTRPGRPRLFLLCPPAIRSDAWTARPIGGGVSYILVPLPRITYWQPAFKPRFAISRTQHPQRPRPPRGLPIPAWKRTAVGRPR